MEANLSVHLRDARDDHPVHARIAPRDGDRSTGAEDVTGVRPTDTRERQRGTGVVAGTAVEAIHLAVLYPGVRVQWCRALTGREGHVAAQIAEARRGVDRHHVDRDGRARDERGAAIAEGGSCGGTGRHLSGVAVVIGDDLQGVRAVIAMHRLVGEVGDRAVDLRERAGDHHGAGAITGCDGTTAEGPQREGAVSHREGGAQGAGAGIGVGDGHAVGGGEGEVRVFDQRGTARRDIRGRAVDGDDVDGHLTAGGERTAQPLRPGYERGACVAIVHDEVDLHRGRRVQVGVGVGKAPRERGHQARGGVAVEGDGERATALGEGADGGATNGDGAATERDRARSAEEVIGIGPAVARQGERCAVPVADARQVDVGHVGCRGKDSGRSALGVAVRCAGQAGEGRGDVGPVEGE